MWSEDSIAGRDHVRRGGSPGTLGPGASYDTYQAASIAYDEKQRNESYVPHGTLSEAEARLWGARAPFMAFYILSAFLCLGALGDYINNKLNQISASQTSTQAVDDPNVSVTNIHKVPDDFTYLASVNISVIHHSGLMLDYDCGDKVFTRTPESGQKTADFYAGDGNIATVPVEYLSYSGQLSCTRK